MADPKDRSAHISSQQGLKEQRQAFEKDNATRSRSQTLLNPDDILNGKQDAAQLWRFVTSNGGGPLRPLTMEDLLEFTRQRDRLQKKYAGGIKLKDIIDLSLPDDRKRAQQQIHQAMPHTHRGGELRFMTNAGPDSDSKRHYVTVSLRDFTAAVVSPKPPKEIVPVLLKGAVSVSCDCGRWRYWYAYMATAGNYNADTRHRESAYPKIRNPKLHGLACKHILRVVTSLQQSPAVKAYLARMVEGERNQVSTRQKRVTKDQMLALAEQMKTERSRTRQIKTTAEKRDQRKAQPGYQRQLQAARDRRANSASKAAAKKPVTDAKFLANLRAMGFSEAQAQAALAATKNAG